MLTPNDQLKAAKMSPRTAILVRAANRRMKTLVIARSDDFDGEVTKKRINFFSLASKPSMRVLPTSDEPFPDYPMTTTRLSKWNCLLVDEYLDQITVELIVTAFSAVIDLKFEKYDNFSYDNLIALLKRPEWANQLTNLMVISFEINSVLPNDRHLVAAINGLSALQYLAAQLDNDSNLTILAQLKMIAIDVVNDPSNILRSLEHYIKSNINLQVHLLSEYNYTSTLIGFSKPLCSRIVRYGRFYLDWFFKDVPRFCHQFSSLVSLSVKCFGASKLGSLFVALSTLPQLVHLGLSLNWSFEDEEENQLAEQQPPRRPLVSVELTSVRALNLNLSISSHLHLQWLNLAVTLPRLEAIQLMSFSCDSCKIDLLSYIYRGYNKNTSPNISTALKCLCTTLPLIHPGVSHNQIFLGGDDENYHYESYYNDEEPNTTLEQLFSTSQ